MIEKGRSSRVTPMAVVSWFALFAILACLPWTGVAEEVAPPPPTAEQLEKWARDLGADDFQLREEAQRRLAAAGPAAVPVLKKAVKSDDPEVCRRAERLLAPLNRGDRLAEAAQALGDAEWENVSRAIDVLLERCDEKSRDAVAQAAEGTGRTATMAKVLLAEIEKVRMADKEIARMLELGKHRPAVRKVVERKMVEVQRVYRERAYESCLKQFEKPKAGAPQKGTKPE